MNLERDLIENSSVKNVLKSFKYILTTSQTVSNTIGLVRANLHITNSSV